MNLNNIRQRFAEISGRFDLLNSNPDLIDFFLNEGSKFLDRSVETQKTWASVYKFLEVGESLVEVQHCRAIKEVWVSNAEGARWQLEKKSIQDLLSDELSEVISLLDTGDALYYAPAVTRQVPESGNLPGGYSSYADIIISSGYKFNAILIAPPTSARLLVDVRGLYYSVDLTEGEGTDANYWSSQHPGLLLKAAMRENDIFNQNPAKVRGWEKAINDELVQIGFDLVEEIIADVDEMGD